MNTKITVLCRDEDNFKLFSDIIVPGEFTEDQLERFGHALIDEEFLDPDDIPVDVDRYPECPFVEIDFGSFSKTNRIPTVDMTIDELISRMETSKANYTICTTG